MRQREMCLESLRLGYLYEIVIIFGFLVLNISILLIVQA